MITVKARMTRSVSMVGFLPWIARKVRATAAIMASCGRELRARISTCPIVRTDARTARRSTAPCSTSGGDMTVSHHPAFIRLAAFGALALFAGAAASAESYPSKPIEVVVHTSAGSGGDVLERQAGEIIRQKKFLPEPFLVVNRTGGGGVIAYNFYKSKRGDPYYILSVTSTLLAMAYRPDVKITLDQYKPIALFAIDPQAIMVSSDSPYKTFDDLAQAIKKEP